MRESIKQRLVGAAVLIALAVVFIPVLFNLEPPRVIDTHTQIPQAPDIEPVIIDEPARVEDVEAPKPAEQAFLPAETTTPEQGSEQHPVTAEEPDSAPAPTPQPAPASTPAPAAKTAPQPAPGLGDDQQLDAWVVQVASYKDAAGAEEMVVKLKLSGFKAFSRAARSGGATVNRVFVGPVLIKDQALEHKRRIDKEFGVSALVLPFEP